MPQKQSIEAMQAEALAVHSMDAEAPFFSALGGGGGECCCH
jgi:hypothetical protein